MLNVSEGYILLTVMYNNSLKVHKIMSVVSGNDSKVVVRKGVINKLTKMLS